jgi:hypothetical protein
MEIIAARKGKVGIAPYFVHQVASVDLASRWRRWSKQAVAASDMIAASMLYWRGGLLVLQKRQA